MSKVQEIIAKRFLGAGAEKDGSGDGPAMPPFVASILSGLGITPDAIQQYAEILKNAVLEMRQEMHVIREQNERILQQHAQIETKLAEIEHNIGSLQPDEKPTLEPNPEFSVIETGGCAPPVIAE